MVHTLRTNCLLKHVTEVKEEVKGNRRRRRRKQLVDDLKGTRRYCKHRREAPDRTLWRTHF